MKRFAAHRICFSPEIQYETAYVELDRQNRFVRTAPLDMELESTVFLNGVLLMVSEQLFANVRMAAERINDMLSQNPQITLAELLRKAEITGVPCQGLRYYLLHLENFDFEANSPRNEGVVKIVPMD